MKSLKQNKIKKYSILLCVLVALTIVVAWWMSYREEKASLAELQQYEECSQALYASPTSTPAYAPFVCRLEIGGGEKDVIMRISDKEGNSVVEMFRNGTRIVSMEGSETGEHYFEILSYYVAEQPEVRSDAFLIEDVTYDGYADIAFLAYSGAYNFAYRIYAYNPMLHSFDTAALLEVINPFVDHEEKQIVSYAKGRGIGDTFYAETYKFIDGKYILIERVDQEMVDWENPEKGYVQIQKKIKDGEVIEINRQYLSYEEVMGEPYQ